MNRLTCAGVTAVLMAGSLWAGGVAEAGRLPSAVSVCVDASSGVVSRVATSSQCVGGAQSWSVSKSAPLLCWNASSLDPLDRTRLVSVAASSGCAAPLRSVPVGKVLLLCADGKTGVLRWPVTGMCELGNQQTWVRSAATPTTVATTTSTTSTTSTTVVVVPSVSLSATLIQDNTNPKAVTVTANVAGTIYFAEGAFVVKTVTDITSAPSHRWAKGTVTSANTPTSIAIDINAVTNGYYRVYVANSQGVLSAPATNIVTISITRASTATTTSTTVAVRTQTLDQSDPGFGNGCRTIAADSTMGQIFRAGLSGPLSRVSLQIIKNGTVTGFVASIYASNGTGAIGSALASKSILGTAVPAYTGCNSSIPTPLVHVDFAIPASLIAGNQYIVVLTTADQRMMMTGGDFGWNLSAAISGGVSSPLSLPSANPDGFVFRTYVDI